MTTQPLKLYKRVDYNPQTTDRLEGMRFRTQIDVLANVLKTLPQDTYLVIRYAEQTNEHTATSASYYFFIEAETLDQFSEREGL